MKTVRKTQVVIQPIRVGGVTSEKCQDFQGGFDFRHLDGGALDSHSKHYRISPTHNPISPNL